MRWSIRFLLNLAVVWLAFRRLLASLGLAESSILWTTPTTGDGTASYTEAQATAHWADWFTPNSTIASPHTTQGVLAGAGGELGVTGTASPVAVAAGAAICEGYPYRNTTSVSVTIPTPSSATRVDYIVLRVSHSTTRTVRITRIAGTEGAGPPSLTQVAGTTWDIPLATVSVTTGGVITVTDQRAFCHFATRLDRSRIDGSTSTRVPFSDANGRLTDSADFTFNDSSDTLSIGGESQIISVSATQMQIKHTSASSATIDIEPIASDGTSDAVVRIGRTTNTSGETSLQVLRGNNSNVAGIKASGSAGVLTITPATATPPIVLGSNGQGQKVVGLNADQLDSQDGTYYLAFANFTGQATNAQLANDSVDDTKAGNRVVQFYRRQGGSATDWTAQGTTAQTPAMVREQVGARDITLPNGSNTQIVAITFPVAFSQPPLVFVSMLDDIYDSTNNATIVCGATNVSITTTGFNIQMGRGGAASGAITRRVAWRAVGAE